MDVVEDGGRLKLTIIRLRSRTVAWFTGRFEGLASPEVVGFGGMRLLGLVCE